MPFFEASSAVFSECGTFRYRLDRVLPYRGPVLSVTMVNPSKAGAEVNDPTIKKIIGFAQRLRVSRFVVTNQFAYISTDVRALAHAEDPIGPKNDQHIREAAVEADIHVVAWGPLAKLPAELRNRWRRVVRLIEKAGGKPKCWGAAADGHPRHPLMLAYSTELIDWSAPRERC